MKYWDIKPKHHDWNAHDHAMAKLVKGLPTRGFIEGEHAFLILYKPSKPSESVILKERI